ncbi:MAG: peroxide stress protein YaaA, partial [Candidatus Brocadiaceae bacterium]|nr:peroxide stress protein YaaA [Candidatus Brocadiaceae bacterium]
MLIVISPAKTLDFTTPTLTKKYSQPGHLKQSRQLIRRLREFSPDDVSSMMKVSDKIARLNVERFSQWKTPFKPDNSRQAMFAFKGDVYLGLDAYSMSAADIEFAQQHLRILSGLYGVLRPLDLIQPYRLEMGSRLSAEQGDNLYQFWGSRITSTVNTELASSNSPLVVNLASTEYFKSINTANLNAEVVTPVFKDFKNGKYKIISFFAKKARGLMTRYIIDHKITDKDSIRKFDLDGYQYDETLS